LSIKVRPPKFSIFPPLSQSIGVTSTVANVH
jgi:hypothetical protein